MRKKFVVLIVLSVMCCFLGSLSAQETDEEFHSTKEDFLRALKPQEPELQAIDKVLPQIDEVIRLAPMPTPTSMPTPMPSIKAGNIKTPWNDEYRKLTQNPMARSLILFDTNCDCIQSESYVILRNFAEILRDDLADDHIVIVGHTDNRGTNEYNVELSKRRAQSVKDFLVLAYGIEEKRLVIRWFGETQSIATNDTDEGRAKNRRVEFVNNLREEEARK